MDDKTLIKKIKEGDRNSIRLLVENHENLVWHIIISMIGRNIDSEDIYQEVFLQVFKGLGNFRADSRLSTWIGSVAHHICVDYLRKIKKEREIVTQDSEHIKELNMSTNINWKQIEEEDLNRKVLETISELPVVYRTLITLYHFDDCSYKEIAEITNMPEGTVKSYINRGRAMLKEILVAQVPDINEIMN